MEIEVKDKLNRNCENFLLVLVVDMFLNWTAAIVLDQRRTKYVSLRRVYLIYCSFKHLYV